MAQLKKYPIRHMHRTGHPGEDTMKTRILLSVVFGLLICSVPSMARGDKIITLIADGVNTSDGTTYRTIIDLMNLGPFDAVKGVDAKITFYQQNGQPWQIATDRGTASQFQINLGPFETTRMQTSGVSPLAVGYAVIHNSSADIFVPNFAEDFEVSPSVFYKILKGGSVIQTVSVPVGQRTLHWQFPFESDPSQKLQAGMAILNLAGETNEITLKVYRASGPNYGTPDAKTTRTLSANSQISLFVDELFPSLGTFRGSLEAFSQKPAAILSLLQTKTPTGDVQYATLAPAYIDSLRRNSIMYLPQGSPIDLDLPVVDYFADITDTTGQDALPWDIIYEPTTGTSRHFKLVSGAQATTLGILTDSQFDAVTVDSLQTKVFSTNNIDLSAGSPNLAFGFTVAVKTGLGQYAKFRLVGTTTGTSTTDLILEAYVFK
jgi:hypothetical protein